MKRVVLCVLACTSLLSVFPCDALSQSGSGSASSPEALAEGLRQVGRQYGEDTVRLQTLLFTNALKADPFLAVEVGVDGMGEFRGRKWLALHVDTGLIFNARTDDEQSRLRAIWSRIVAPSLLALKSLRLPADGVGITLGYHHRPYASREELQDTIEDTGARESAVLNLAGRDILALLAGDLTEQGLLDRSSLSVNGRQRRLSLEGAGQKPPPLH